MTPDIAIISGIQASRANQSRNNSGARSLTNTLDSKSSPARARKLSRLALKSGSPLWTLGATTSTGIAQASNEQWPEAIRLLEQVVERTDERGLSQHDLGGVLSTLAQAYLSAHRLDDALAASERAVRTCRKGEMKSWECRARIGLARARIAKEGKTARRKIRTGLKRAEELIEETNAEGYRPFVFEARAALARACDDPDTAASELSKAQRLFREMQATGHASRLGDEPG